MIFSASFSKPSNDCEKILGRPYKKVRIFKNPLLNIKPEKEFQIEFFTEKQAFQKNVSLKEAQDFIQQHAGTTFKNCVVRTESEEKTFMANKKGEVKIFTRQIASSLSEQNFSNGFNRAKNYILQEGNAIPFLVELGVMTKDGKVIAQKYDKFRQINRFLEFIDDIIDSVLKLNQSSYTQENPLRIVDFGSGKSYLTFAVYYFLNDIKKIPVQIIGLDLKEDVIKNCSNLAKKLSFTNLEFFVGDIAQYTSEQNPDIIITLHACDTATDYALNYAIKKNAKAILSVPCCQHEINLQLENQKFANKSCLSSIMKYGILRERFASLATDALRAELLEQNGYNVQLLEFIDMSHTPKNILIRAIKKQGASKSIQDSIERACSLLNELKVKQTLVELNSK